MYPHMYPLMYLAPPLVYSKSASSFHSLLCLDFSACIGMSKLLQFESANQLNAMQLNEENKHNQQSGVSGHYG